MHHSSTIIFSLDLGAVGGSPTIDFDANGAVFGAGQGYVGRQVVRAINDVLRISALKHTQHLPLAELQRSIYRNGTKDNCYRCF